MRKKTMSWAFTIFSVILIVTIQATYGYVAMLLAFTATAAAVASAYFDCAADIERVMEKEIDDLIRRVNEGKK